MGNKKNRIIKALLVNDSKGNKYLFSKPNAEGKYKQLIINNKLAFSGKKIEITINNTFVERYVPIFLEHNDLVFSIRDLDSNEDLLCIDGKIFNNTGQSLLELIKKDIDEDKKKLLEKYSFFKGIINKVNNYRDFNYYNGKGFIKVFFDEKLNMNISFDDEIIETDFLNKLFGKNVEDFYNLTLRLNSVHYDVNTKNLYSFFNTGSGDDEIIIYKNDIQISLSDFLGNNSTVENKLKVYQTREGYVIKNISFNNFYYSPQNDLFFRVKIEKHNNNGDDELIYKNYNKELLNNVFFNQNINYFSKYAIDESTGKLKAINRSKLGKYEVTVDGKVIGNIGNSAILDYNSYQDKPKIIFKNKDLFILIDRFDRYSSKKDIILFKVNYKDLDKGMIKEVDVSLEQTNISYNSKESKIYISRGLDMEDLPKISKLSFQGKIGDININNYLSKFIKKRPWQI